MAGAPSETKGKYEITIMTFNPDIHHRRSIRLKNNDYTRAGVYFVTMCSWNRECLFGDISDGQMRPSEYGEIVEEEWLRTGMMRAYITLDSRAVMPNHFHGILVIHDLRRGTARRAPTAEQFSKPVPGSLPTIIRSFKSAVTKTINRLRNTPGLPVWQRNYYEHIIRNENELYKTRHYIENNPAGWDVDEENPDAGPKPL